MRVAAYVYPGWHPIPERDRAFHPGFTEWELVRACRPRFEGHHQPRVPALGEYDDRDPHELGRRVRLAQEHGVLCVPGSTFGPGLEGYLRFAFANLEAQAMAALVARLAESQRCA